MHGSLMWVASLSAIVIGIDTTAKYVTKLQLSINSSRFYNLNEITRLVFLLLP